MDFYEVLEKRRTVRDFSDRKVTDEVLKKILAAAFKAPTNDHLRQFEFVVVRGQENIARVIAPPRWQHTRVHGKECRRAGERDGQRRIRHVHGRDAQTTENAGRVGLPRAAFLFPQRQPAPRAGMSEFAQLEGLACALHIPIEQEAEHVKQAVNAPDGYEFPCFIAIGYAAPDAHLPRQKVDNVDDRMHQNVWRPSTPSAR